MSIITPTIAVLLFILAIWSIIGIISYAYYKDSIIDKIKNKKKKYILLSLYGPGAIVVHILFYIVDIVFDPIYDKFDLFKKWLLKED
jgi:hypothetical protein